MILNLTELDQYRHVPVPADYPDNLRTFYAPIDDVAGALYTLVDRAQYSIVAMYEFDNDKIAGALIRKLKSDKVFVQLTLDKSQAGGVHERLLLERTGFPASSVAIGPVNTGGIMHMKMMIIDGSILVTGSTNCSSDAETRQDGQLTVISDPTVCAEARARVDTIHAHIIKESR